MAPLITASTAEFAEALPDGGKLGGLDVGTRTIGIAICDAGWHFAGPAETIRRTKFTQDLEALRKFVANETIAGLVVGLPLNMDGSDQPAHPVGPRLRPQPGAARSAGAAVGRALVDPGGRAGDDRRRRQPRQARREGRRARRRPHPAGRDRRAGQSPLAAISEALVDLLSIDALTDAADRRNPRPGAHLVRPRTGRTRQRAAARQAGLQRLLRKLDPHRDVLRDRDSSAWRVARSRCRSSIRRSRRARRWRTRRGP